MIENFALIIGAMKCGTSSLFHYLSQHPEVSPCRAKEPNYFANNNNWLKGFEWYQNLWNFDPAIHKIALEASTHYTKLPAFPNAAERISTIPANFKFIYVVRNPIERIESHYNHGRLEKWGEHLDIDQEIDRHAINISRYSMQLDEYYKRFPADNILVVNFDDLKRDTISLTKKVCQFLDINPQFEFQKLSEKRNTSLDKRIRSNSLLSYLSSITKPLIPAQQKALIRTMLTEENFSHLITGQVKLSEQQINFVLNELRDDLRRLKTDYGVNISQWNIEV